MDDTTEREEKYCLEWEEPMSSAQAAKYLLTRGFVAVELHKVRLTNMRFRVEQLQKEATTAAQDRDGWRTGVALIALALGEKDPLGLPCAVIAEKVRELKKAFENCARAMGEVNR